MFFLTESDSKKSALTWLDETKRLCHELSDNMNQQDYPSETAVQKFIGTPVADRLAELHVAVNGAILALSQIMVEDQTTVEMSGGAESAPQRVRTFGELFEALDKRVKSHGCTPDLLHVRGICNENGLDADQVVPFLEKHGAGCDCEVLLNVANRIGADKRLPVLAF